MALWHGVEFYEKEKVVGEEFYQQWPNVSFSIDSILINTYTVESINLSAEMQKLYMSFRNENKYYPQSQD